MSELEKLADEIGLEAWDNEFAPRYGRELIASLRQEVEELREALKSCADDLEAELKGRYTSLDQPIVARRLERDMDTVRRARALLPKDKP